MHGWDAQAPCMGELSQFKPDHSLAQAHWKVVPFWPAMQVPPLWHGDEMQGFDSTSQ